MKPSDAQLSSVDHSASLADLYFNAPIGLCNLDLELRYIHINQWLADLNGIPAQGHIGKTISEVLPEAAKGIEPQLREVIESGQPMLQGMVAIETPAEPGVVKHFRHNFYPEINEDGRVVGVACSVMEITDLWRAEQLIIKQAEELQQSNKQLEQFAYIVSHDLQGPLRNMYICADILQSEHADQLELEGREFLDHILSLIHISEPTRPY